MFWFTFRLRCDSIQEICRIGGSPAFYFCESFVFHRGFKQHVWFKLASLSFGSEPHKWSGFFHTGSCSEDVFSVWDYACVLFDLINDVEQTLLFCESQVWLLKYILSDLQNVWPNSKCNCIDESLVCIDDIAYWHRHLRPNPHLRQHTYTKTCTEG